MDTSHQLPQLPTSILPLLRRLDEHSLSDISPAVSLLRALYLPQVRGISIISTTPTSYMHSTVSSSHTLDVSESHNDKFEEERIKEAWIAARADEFERSFAIKWLTGFISRAEIWVDQAPDKDSPLSMDTPAKRRAVVDEAAALLAACAGTSASGPVIRTFQFPRKNKREPAVQVNLRDAALDSQDHTGVGLQTWGSSFVLAERLVEEPEWFGMGAWASLPPSPSPKLPPASSVPVSRRLRVLELGAGTGLLSLVLAKLFGAGEYARDVSIIATDFHEAVLANLRKNVEANSTDSSILAPAVHRLDWLHWHQLLQDAPLGTSPAALLQSQSAPFNAPFDLIIGADIIYESAHSEWIKSCLEMFLRRPDELGLDGDGEPFKSRQFYFHLIIPLRATHQMESDTVPATFPTIEQVRKRRLQDQGGSGDKLELAIVGAEELSRAAGPGDADEVRYQYYRIGWV